MNINDNYLQKSVDFESAGIRVPKSYDFETIKKNTVTNPKWVHFGGGNLFRCMQARQQQILLEKGLDDTGIILAETWDDGLITGVYNQFSNRTLNVILKENGTYNLELVDAVTEAHYVNPNVAQGQVGWQRMQEIFSNPSLQLASLTVTEKGYQITNMAGEYFAQVAQEIAEGPEHPQTLMGVLASLLYTRYKAGVHPIALLSTDNFSHNGDKLKSSILQIVTEWTNNQLVEADFVDYLNDPQKVAFPYSMIDRITPAPSEEIASKLKVQGFENVDIIKTPKSSISAAFVNTEETNYLVVEDNFPNGRPVLEQAGVIFTSREKVDEVERMKVCTCLNPLHTALAILGCLLGYKKISDEVKDTSLLALIKKIGYQEGMPVVTDPGIISPKQFIDEVINKRLPNPYIPDTPQRIASDTSQKLPIRFGVTIDLYKKSLNLDVKNLNAISFVLAAWLRYLIGVDDFGNKFTRSPDPMLEELDSIFSQLTLGSSVSQLEIVKPVLVNQQIFGVNLETADLADKVFRFFVRLMQGPGAVREVLEEVALG